MSSVPTLSGQVLSATAWNTLLLPARFLVALVASVVFYRVLSLEQVGLLFLITSLAATLGFNADLGIERTLPRFLPEVEQRSGREGVRRLIRQVIRVKLLVLVALLLGLLALERPLGRFLASQERAEAARLERRAEALRGGPAAEATALLEQALAKRELAGQIERQGPVFVAVVGALLLFGALYDVHMKVLTAYFNSVPGTRSAVVTCSSRARDRLPGRAGVGGVLAS
jgi:O-antigen/teichoic acid export membrane protein